MKTVGRVLSVLFAMLFCFLCMTEAVMEGSNIRVSSVAVKKDSVKLSVGDTYKLKFTIRPENATDKGLKLKSSDPTVASVSKKGVITGLKAGKAVITATTVDGSGLKVKIKVTVTNDGYMKNTKGVDYFNRVVAGERMTMLVEGGNDEWYDRGTEVNGISFEVHSKGADGQLVFVEVLDMYQTGKKDMFYKVLEELFSGDDLTKAKAWVKKNLGKIKRTKIGDATIVLDQTTTEYPIMYITDDEHADWV